VIDSHRAKMLHQHAVLARYFFPREDVSWDRLGDVEPISPPAGSPGLDDLLQRGGRPSHRRRAPGAPETP
jgi:hypothetical protein